jgi:phosphatidylinositol-3-phosphatase
MTSIGTRAARTGIVLLAGILAIQYAAANRAQARSSAEPEREGATPLPRPDHTVVVILENHAYSDVIGNASAPYINSLKSAGANFTNSHAVAHPSQPNYLALFEGDTQNLSDNSCPHAFFAPNLATGLLMSGQSFLGYSESMPSNGYTGCGSGNYVRRHNPWVNYINVPASVNLTFEAFPADYGELPTVAYVVPDLCHDMHDCSVATGDAWLQGNLDRYVQWAGSHNSLFILTFDEDAGNTATNQIATIFVGPMVEPGDYAMRIDHYNFLRTLEDMYGVPATAKAANAESITGVWKSPPPTPIPRAPIFPVPRPSRPTPGAR